MQALWHATRIFPWDAIIDVAFVVVIVGVYYPLVRGGRNPLFWRWVMYLLVALTLLSVAMDVVYRTA